MLEIFLGFFVKIHQLKNPELVFRIEDGTSHIYGEMCLEKYKESVKKYGELKGTIVEILPCLNLAGFEELRDNKKGMKINDRIFGHEEIMKAWIEMEEDDLIPPIPYE